MGIWGIFGELKPRDCGFNSPNVGFWSLLKEKTNKCQIWGA